MRRIPLIGCALSAAVTLAACAVEAPDPVEPPPSAQGETTFTDFGSAVDEYWETADEFELPDGYSYPDPSFNDVSGSYQTGYGRGEAVRVWRCAWGTTYLTAFGEDPTTATEALEVFATIVDTDVFANSYDPASMQPVIRDAIERARLGDPSAMQSITDGGCPK
ncbi:hypothetical protein [Homoserinibacter sp. GY 40078]|uniref:hypothetical protein n=1 Tax=Homoserinibacter sp. GY 40078 TaxID=2603275 RepID=UPI0011CB9BDC|nr:hypothetical protein [Homoserinibacter sp. GY 40078]TXK16368.1 hypothetical protein FVQ89_14050 [Homoserinibacter sp. GY 40078]